MSTALPAKSRRKAEWPNQVICMMRVPLSKDVSLIQNKGNAVKINHARFDSLHALC
jgi:hypothetical protein